MSIGYFSPNLIWLFEITIYSNSSLKTATIHSRLSNSLSADDITLMAESEEELKCLLMKMKVESEKVGFKLNIQKTKIMASGPITSWNIDGERVETMPDFIFLGLQDHCR